MLTAQTAFGATFLVRNASEDGLNSLRWAITNANNRPGLDEIAFDLPLTGGVIPAILLNNPLPHVTDPVVIDGYTQPGSRGNTLSNGNNAVILVELRARRSLPSFSILSGDSKVRGLAINGLSLSLETRGRNLVEGNFIGLDRSGTAVGEVNGGVGLIVRSPDNFIGGATPFARNVIAAHMSAGIQLLGSGSNNVVQGNFIGTTRTGTGSVLAQTTGISAGTPGNLITSNVIAFHRDNAVEIAATTAMNNSISANSIFDNAGLGIDLGPAGVTPNDHCDVDTGAANELQNSPVLRYATNGGGRLVIEGYLASAPGQIYRIEFFASPQCDESGSGEGKTYLGSTEVLTGGNCVAAFTTSFNVSLAACSIVTATATDARGNTSEFSNCAAVDGVSLVDLSLAGEVRPNPVSVGSNLTYTVGIVNSGPCTATDVELRCVLPQGVAFVSGPGCVNVQGQIVCTLADITPGVSASHAITVRPLASGLFTATFQVSSLQSDGDQDNNRLSLAAKAEARPIVSVFPAVTNVPPGASVTFCAQLSGTGPFEIQWRRNGVNIAGETNRCLQIDNVQVEDGGTYTVVVANDAGATVSASARLVLDLERIQGSDLFTNRTIIGGFSGLIVGTNTTATLEPNEPRHFDKPGGGSVWYAWTAPTTGIATFRTYGSTFDTLLAVYLQCSPSNLVEVAADDDLGRELTSFVRFNVIQGVTYYIVVDGFAGAMGQFTLAWQAEASSLLPVILVQPKSVTVAPGDTVTFSVDAVPGARDIHPECRRPTGTALLQYQWLSNGVPIVGARDFRYSISGVRTQDVGSYSVRVSTFDHTIESRLARLQINVTGRESLSVQAENKFEDAAERPPIELGNPPPQPAPAPQDVLAAAGGAGGGGIVRGYTGTQIFDTTGSTTEPSDEPVCGVIGGASQWITFVPLESGVLYLNTDGSTYNTVMAVFRRSPNNPAVLQMIECDNNSGLDGRDSALSVSVTAGVTNFVMVDGVNGQTGILVLNYSLVTASALTCIGMTSESYPILRLTGRPDMVFTFEVSSNMLIWAPLVTTNSPSEIFDYTDESAPNGMTRYYRALMLPW